MSIILERDTFSKTQNQRANGPPSPGQPIKLSGIVATVRRAGANATFVVLANGATLVDRTGACADIVVGDKIAVNAFSNTDVFQKQTITVKDVTITDPSPSRPPPPEDDEENEPVVNYVEGIFVQPSEEPDPADLSAQADLSNPRSPAFWGPRPNPAKVKAEERRQREALQQHLYEKQQREKFLREERIVREYKAQREREKAFVAQVLPKREVFRYPEQGSPMATGSSYAVPAPAAPVLIPRTFGTSSAVLGFRG